MIAPTRAAATLMDTAAELHAKSSGRKRCGIAPGRPRAWLRRTRASANGCARTIPGSPPWHDSTRGCGPDDVTMRGHFRRFHVGRQHGRSALAASRYPLFYSTGTSAIDRAPAARPTRQPLTAYLHVDYRKITPIRRTTGVARRVSTTIDGRKAFVSATMTDSDGTVLSEANGLMIRLLPHQP